MFLVYFFQMKLKTKMSILILYKLEKISFIRTIISVKMIILDMQSLKIWLIQFVISIFMVSNINSISIDVITQNVLQKISLGPPPPFEIFPHPRIENF